jgi:hypothetical protein
MIELEVFLRDMGLVKKKEPEEPKEPYPDIINKNYFNDPRDKNGEVPF